MLSMCLGMQVINDELQDIVYERRLKEKAGDLLVNVRMITLQGNHSLSPKYVYLGFENDFLPFANDRNLSAAICIGKTSLQEEIFFEGTDLICVKDGDINQIFERVQLIFEKYNQWDEELTNAIMAQASINDIADIGNKVFSNPIAIFDSSFYCLATSGDLPLQYKDPIWDTLSKTKYVINYDIQTRLKQALGKQLSESKETILLKQFDGGANKPFDILIRHIFKNGIRLGNIGMTEVWAPITYGQTFLCDHFANRLTYWFCCSRNIIASKEPIKQLVTNLIDGKPVTEDAVKSSAAWIGKKRETVLHLISFKLMSQEQNIPVKNETRLQYAEKILSEMKQPQEIVLCYQDYILLIIHASEIYDSNLEYIDRMRNKLRSPFGDTKIGISGPFHEFEGIRTAYFQSVEALSIGSRLNPSTDYYKYADYAVEHMIDEFLKESSSDVFCHPAVKRLYLYDCANGTEYMKTLEAYFLSMGNRARTAEELHIHRNSLAYRIDKMCELVPLDELSKNDLLHCLISCRLLRYLSKNDCLNVRQ